MTAIQSAFQPVGYDVISARMRNNSGALFGGAQNAAALAANNDNAYIVDLSDAAKNQTVFSIAQGNFAYSASEIAVPDFLANFKPAYLEADELGFRPFHHELDPEALFTPGAEGKFDSVFPGAIFNNVEERNQLLKYIDNKLQANGVDFQFIGRTSFSLKLKNEKSTADKIEHYNVECNTSLCSNNVLNPEQAKLINNILKDDTYIIEKLMSIRFNGFGRGTRMYI